MGTKRCENTFVTVIVMAVECICWSVAEIFITGCNLCVTCVSLRCQQVPAWSLRYFGVSATWSTAAISPWPDRIIVTEPETMGRRGAGKQSALIRHKGDKRRRKVSPSDSQSRSAFNWDHRSADKSVSLIPGLETWTDSEDKPPHKHNRSAVLMSFTILSLACCSDLCYWLMMFLFPHHKALWD